MLSKIFRIFCSCRKKTDTLATAEQRLALAGFYGSEFYQTLVSHGQKLNDLYNIPHILTLARAIEHTILHATDQKLVDHALHPKKLMSAACEAILNIQGNENLIVEAGQKILWHEIRPGPSLSDTIKERPVFAETAVADLQSILSAPAKPTPMCGYSRYPEFL